MDRDNPRNDQRGRVAEIGISAERGLRPFVTWTVVREDRGRGGVSFGERDGGRRWG